MRSSNATYASWPSSLTKARANKSIYLKHLVNYTNFDFATRAYQAVREDKVSYGETVWTHCKCETGEVMSSNGSAQLGKVDWAKARLIILLNMRINFGGNLLAKTQSFSLETYLIENGSRPPFCKRND